MSGMEKLRKVIEYNGEYRGVQFSIQNWSFVSNNDDLKNWNYYLHIHLNRMPKESKPKSLWLKDENSYMSHPLLSDLDWHGGITYYSKREYGGRTGKVIKVGCDYMHLWDKGMSYDVRMLQIDAHNTIDSFLARVPNYKCRCNYNGNLYLPDEGTFSEETGEFFSNESNTTK